MSVTTLSYDEVDQRYTLDLRMFLDDFMVVTQGGVENDYQANSLMKKPSKSTIRTYLADNLKISINGTSIPLKVDKIRLEELTIYVIFEIKDLPSPDKIKDIYATDTIFVDQFVNQRNVIHIELPTRKRRSLLFNAYHRNGSIAW